jgi:hypothetical protein
MVLPHDCGRLGGGGAELGGMRQGLSDGLQELVKCGRIAWRATSCTKTSVQSSNNLY